MFMYMLSIVAYFYRQVRVKLLGDVDPCRESIREAPGLKLKEFSHATGALTFEGFSASARNADDKNGVPKTYYVPAAEKRSDMRKRKKSFAAGVDGTGQCVAILTSGGDSQGMNSAIRAATRMAIYAGARVYAVHWGYQGLVDGGDNIKELSWNDVSGITFMGGTILGSARCAAFRERDGRKKAAYNMVSNGITNLIVIGGDGSLTGADIFKREWKSLLDELVKEEKISQEDADHYDFLNIVGMVGSIDNDFCGTDMTIGADTALNRVIECVDAITTTAESHQRAFILEVMGRNCGYLALIAGIGCGADWVFLPEWPPEDGWEGDMCQYLTQARNSGRMLSIIIISEGAQDCHGKAITAEYVKTLITTRLQFDTRVTVLGHVQRGGVPSAFDRLLATRFGAEAALTVIEADRDSEAVVMCLQSPNIVKRPLDECVAKCIAIKKAYAERNWKTAVELRGKAFESSLQVYRLTRNFRPPKSSRCTDDGTCESGCTFAVMNVGAPAGGMNPAVRAFVRSALFHGHRVIGVHDGFEGLLKKQMNFMGWSEVDKWTSMGGSLLGVSRKLPGEQLDEVDGIFRLYGFNALLIIGGFEGFHALLQLTEARKKYDGFKIPMMLIPATMSNNVPGTMFSLGADTTLNVIVECCDRIRQSASSSQDRVFVVETMGGKCGYLATMAGIAGAADAAYIYEEPFTIADLQADVRHLMHKFQTTAIKRGLILRNEACNDNYTTDFITKMYQEEAKGVFVTRNCVLGHIQQGGPPSPFDRLYGARQAAHAFTFLMEQIEQNKDEFGLINATGKESACVLGHTKNETCYSPVEDLKSEADFKNRLPAEQWWLHLRPLLRVMARHKAFVHREDGME